MKDIYIILSLLYGATALIYWMEKICDITLGYKDKKTIKYDIRIIDLGFFIFPIAILMILFPTIIALLFPVVENNKSIIFNKRLFKQSKEEQ